MAMLMFMNASSRGEQIHARDLGEPADMQMQYSHNLQETKPTLCPVSRNCSGMDNDIDGGGSRIAHLDRIWMKRRNALLPPMAKNAAATALALTFSSETQYCSGHADL